MRPHTEPLTVSHHLLVELAACDYLTPSQAARLLEKERSLTYIREQLRSLSTAKLVLSLEGGSVTMPRVYTLTRKGREYASLLCSTPTDKRFRPSEERDKARNEYFITHTLAVTDVLIAARLLEKTTPGITLKRMFTERALRGVISVRLPDATGNGMTHPRTISIAPDASLDFLIQKTWQNFLHIEVYRNLPPAEWRFKQKIKGYVTYAISGQHEVLFHTPSLSIVVIAQSEPMATTLKRWTEQALQESNQTEHGELFFFTSLNPATASPEELYLSPVWQQAFGTAKIPLLILE